MKSIYTYRGNDKMTIFEILQLILTILVIAIIISLMALAIVYYRNKEQESGTAFLENINKNIKKGSEEEFSFVSKSWEEPMNIKETHEEQLINNFQEPMKTNQKDIIFNHYHEEEDFIIEENEDGSIRILKNSKHQDDYQNTPSNNDNIDSAENRLNNSHDDENYIRSQEMDKLDSDEKISQHTPLKSNTSFIKNGNVYDLKIGDNIIFYYNGETYSSKILNIKHENLEVIYRSSKKWISVDNIKKVL
jgi:hypothetical protein